jgi:hypothetical protein
MRKTIRKNIAPLLFVALLSLTAHAQIWVDNCTYPAVTAVPAYFTCATAINQFATVAGGGTKTSGPFTITAPASVGLFQPFTASVEFNPSTYGTYSAAVGFTYGSGSLSVIVNATFAAPAPTVTGYLNPKYKIVGVVYSPPGSSSYVQYTDTTMMGTSTSTQQSFAKNESSSVMVCGAANGDIGLANSGVKVCGTYSNSFTQQTSNSSSFAVQQTSSFVNKWPGSSNALNHGNDVVYVWLNPVAWFTVPDNNPPVATPVQWNGYGSDGADDIVNGGEMEVVPIYLSQLLNPSTIATSDPALYDRLQRTWALNNLDGTAPGLTDADYALIAAADPFSDPDYVFSVPATPPGNLTSADGRFTQTTNQNLDYQPGTATAPAPTFTYSWAQTTTQTQGQGTMNTYQQGVAMEESFKDGIFGQELTLDFKQGLQFTWVDQWNSLTTEQTGQASLVSITGPSYCIPGTGCTPYEGPQEFNIFEDNIYGTFMMEPVLASFTISAMPTSQTVAPSGSTSYSLSTTVAGGYTGSLTLSMQPGLPSGASATLTPNPISAGSSSTLTINTTASTPPGTYPLAVLATDGTLIYYAYFALVVATPDFSIAVSPSSQTITAGSGTAYTVSTTALNRFIGNVTLTTGTLPSGISATFSPNPVAASSSSTMTVSSTPSASAGSYSLTVNGTSGSLEHTVIPMPILIVNPAATTTTTALVSSLNPSGLGQSVKFTATVSSPAGGTPTGSVVFKNSTATLATKTLSASTASYSTTALPLGSSSITAVYSGDSTYTGSTSTPVVQVVQTATATTLSSSVNPSAFGRQVTFTATVTSSSGAPPNGETISFMKGTTVLGTGTLSGGSASFITSTLPVATNAIKAVYGGDANLVGSTSAVVSQVVSPATTTVNLVSSINPSSLGQSVTFTATVVPQFSGTPTGTVTFYDGTTALKTSSLSGGAVSYSTTTLTHGTHSITATYNGSTSFTGSSASLTQTVN